MGGVLPGGGYGTLAKAGVSKATNVVKIAQKSAKVTDIIKGFNHDGTFHGLNQIVTRKVDPKVIKQTILRPLQKILQKDGRVRYISQK